MYRNKKGFTLIELLIVIAIIGIIAAVVVLGLAQSAKEKARIAASLKFADSVRAQLSSNEVAWWKFEEPAGTSGVESIKDFWGSYNAQPFGGITMEQEGVVNGKAFEFDGSNDYVLTPVGSQVNYFRAGSCNNSIPWTTSMWFKTSTSTYADGKGMIMGSGGGGGTAVNYTVYIEDGGLYVRFLTETNGITLAASDDKWHLLVVTWDTVDANAYFDGEGVGILSVPSGVCGQTYTLVIGATNSSSGNMFYNGRIDEIKVWTNALTAQQIQQIYAESSPRHGIALK